MAGLRRGGFAAAGVAGLMLVGWAALADDTPRLRVSQKDQAFKPNILTIKQGTVLDVVNDDGDLLHHAYVDSPKMKFDSGDQEPGQTASIPFNTPGSFQVLCGIHPKMKLRVTVDPK